MTHKLATRRRALFDAHRDISDSLEGEFSEVRIHDPAWPRSDRSLRARLRVSTPCGQGLTCSGAEWIYWMPHSPGPTQGVSWRIGPGQSALGAILARAPGRTVYHVRKVADWEGLHTLVLVEEDVRGRVRHLVLQRERG